MKQTFALLAIVLAVGVQAKPIAWYHFDEHEPGVRVSRDRAWFVNSANPGMMNLYAAIRNNPGTLLDSKDQWLPYYTEAFPSGLSWRDPVSAKVGTSNTGVYMNSSQLDGSEFASLLYADLTQEFCKPTITVEVIFKADFQVAAPHWVNLIVCDGPTANIPAWSIRLPNGEAGTSINYTMSWNNGGTATQVSRGYRPSKSIYDGNWHHVALVFNGQYNTLTSYFDYIQRDTWSCNHPIGYDFTKKLYIAGYPPNNYASSFRGWIKEVRISDTKLKPEEFLRYGDQGRENVCDDATRLYLSFDRMYTLNQDGQPDPFFGLYNECTNAGAYSVEVMTSGKGKAPTAGGIERPLTTFHHGFYGKETRTDEGCWNFATNKPASSSLISVNDRITSSETHDFTSEDFTAEMFIRFNGKGPYVYTQYLFCEHSPDGGAGLVFFMQGGNNCGDLVLQAIPNGDDSLHSITIPKEKANLLDQKWHHVALVGDRTRRYLGVFIDYEYIGGLTDFTYNSRVNGTTSYTKNFDVLGGYYPGFGVSTAHPDGEGLQCDAHIDELRLTKRALSPQEFLQAGPANYIKPGRTKFHASYEGDYTVAVNPTEIPAGEPNQGVVIDPNAVSKRIADGNGNMVKVNNANSAYFRIGAGGQIFYGRNFLLEREMESQTLEFFIRAARDSAVANADIVYTSATQTNSVDDIIWKLSYGAAAGQLAVTVDSTSTADQTVLFDNAKLDDGQWHHVAVVFTKMGGDATMVTVYIDFATIGSQAISGYLRSDTAAMTSLTIGSKDFSGNLDEIRISQGALSISDMMHALSNKGMSIMMRKKGH